MLGAEEMATVEDAARGRPPPAPASGGGAMAATLAGWTGLARIAAAVGYLAVIIKTGPAGAAHWLLATAFAGGAVAGVGRRLWRAAAPFLLFAAAYDLLGRAKPDAAAVHVALPYFVDRFLFGVVSRAGRWSLNEVFAAHHWAAVDFVTGLAYMLYLPAIAAFAIYLLLVDRAPAGRQRALRFGWAFLGVNLAGFITYLLCPVAPPWYVASHGLGAVDGAAAASPAALARWDALTGIPCFAAFYAHASDVFGALPSLHCAYPMLLWLYGRELRRPVLTAALAGFELLMAFSAVYLQHHYVTDVVAGAGYSALGYAVERAISRRRARAPAAVS